MSDGLDTSRPIGVIGAGTMGRGIAQVFAQSGFEVHLHDAVPDAMDAGIAFIHKMLDRAVSKARIEQADADATKERIHPVATIQELPEPQLLIEAASERLEIKLDILKAC